MNPSLIAQSAAANGSRRSQGIYVVASLSVFLSTSGVGTPEEPYQGFFSAPNRSLFGGLESQDIRLAHLDGDGDLDTWVANRHGAAIQPNEVWIHDSRGWFGDSGQALGAFLTDSVSTRSSKQGGLS